MTFVVWNLLLSVALCLSASVFLKFARGLEVGGGLLIVWASSVALTVTTILILTGVLKP